MMEYDFGIRSVPPCDDCDENGHCTMNCSPPSFGKALDATVDQVLQHKPKATTDAQKKRKRKARKAARRQS